MPVRSHISTPSHCVCLAISLPLSHPILPPSLLSLHQTTLAETLHVRRYCYHCISDGQARFGSTAGAYFHFFRWIVLVFLAVMVVSLYFLALHCSKGSFSWSSFGKDYLPFVLLPSSYISTYARDVAHVIIFCYLCLLLSDRVVVCTVRGSSIADRQCEPWGPYLLSFAARLWTTPCTFWSSTLCCCFWGSESGFKRICRRKLRKRLKK